MYGFFNNKRIVLFDTLVEQCNEPQVVAVLAHELGKPIKGPDPNALTATPFLPAAKFMWFLKMQRECSAGHWKLRHTLKNLVIIQFNLLTQFLLFTAIRNMPGLFESFGFVGVKPAFISFTLFSAVSAPLNEVGGVPCTRLVMSDARAPIFLSLCSSWGS